MLHPPSDHPFVLLDPAPYPCPPLQNSLPSSSTMRSLSAAAPRQFGPRRGSELLYCMPLVLFLSLFTFFASQSVERSPELMDGISRQSRLIHNTSKHINEGFFGRSENIQAIERRHSLEKEFDIGSVVGKGNFSQVRIAIRRRDDKKCALKEIAKRSLRGKWFFVENEVEVLAGASHANICQLIDAFQTDNFYYLFFEFAQDGDVFEVVRRRGRLEEREAARVLQQTASALAYLHANSIAHRDVKPENLLLFGNWKVKLADFGLACTVLGPLTRICGTPTYCAPEIVTQLGYGIPVDLWSLGVVMHVVLSGTAPFRAADRAGLFRAIARAQLRLHSTPWMLISSDAKELLRQLLTADPSARISSSRVLSHPWILPRSAQI